MINDNDTIVARATPEGAGGLAVVRLSGAQAVAIAAAVFRATGGSWQPQSHRAVHGTVIWPAGEGATRRAPAGLEPGDLLDEVLLLALLSPRSYTGEDTVEIFCHGGALPARLVVAACLAVGARPAAAGEFSKRAFLHGRLSLDQAEAVGDLIHAEDTLTARAAIQQLQGGLDRQLQAIEEPLLRLQTELEGALEFAEEEELAAPVERCRHCVATAVSDLDRLISLAPAGRQLRDGIQVALVGPVNAGKSSLFNTLLADERALVDPEAGTTRDVVSAHLHLGNFTFVLHDTAGLREGMQAITGRVEQKGLRKTVVTAQQADVILNLREAGEVARGDATLPLARRWNDDEDEDAVAGASDASDASGAGPVHAPAVVIDVLTKGDLLTAGERAQVAEGPVCIVTSSVTNDGIEDLRQALLAVVEQERIDEAVALGLVLNERHQHKMEQCRRELTELAADLADGWPGEEVVASMLGVILSELGEISGRVYNERLLESVFARFCVGK